MLHLKWLLGSISCQSCNGKLKEPYLVYTYYYCFGVKFLRATFRWFVLIHFLSNLGRAWLHSINIFETWFLYENIKSNLSHFVYDMLNIWWPFNIDISHFDSIGISTTKIIWFHDCLIEIAKTMSIQNDNGNPKPISVAWESLQLPVQWYHYKIRQLRDSFIFILEISISVNMVFILIWAPAWIKPLVQKQKISLALHANMLPMI